MKPPTTACTPQQSQQRNNTGDKAAVDGMHTTKKPKNVAKLACSLRPSRQSRQLRHATNNTANKGSDKGMHVRQYLNHLPSLPSQCRDDPRKPTCLLPPSMPQSHRSLDADPFLVEQTQLVMLACVLALTPQEERGAQVWVCLRRVWANFVGRWWEGRVVVLLQMCRKCV
eukprot:363357-Chlamydomonas_euryale.AAC.20